uniref:Uncharacterized protein n=1 Tax=Opuntia streptacantha TaxID=393608 RepID=A0A7C9ATN7_OPUST
MRGQTACNASSPSFQNLLQKVSLRLWKALSLSNSSLCCIMAWSSERGCSNFDAAKAVFAVLRASYIFFASIRILESHLHSLPTLSKSFRISDRAQIDMLLENSVTTILPTYENKACWCSFSWSRSYKI